MAKLRHIEYECLEDRGLEIECSLTHFECTYDDDMTLCGASATFTRKTDAQVDCPDCIAIVDACKGVAEREMKRDV